MEVQAHPEGFNCITCQHRHCDEANPGPPGMQEIPGVIKSSTCLLPMVTDESREWLVMHRELERGHYPLGGGMLEQPAAWRRAMDVIWNRHAVIAQEKAARAAAKG